LANPTDRKPSEFGLHPIKDECGREYEEIRPTLRGLARSRRGQPQHSLLTLHRNGYLELRDDYILEHSESPERGIEFRHFASHCVDFFRLAAKLNAACGYDGEVFVFGLVLRTEGLTLRDEPISRSGGFDLRDADVRECPEVPHLVVEPWSYSTSATPESQAQRFAEIVYNAFGHEKAPSVVDAGYGLR
jgi:hypothetical protein